MSVPIATWPAGASMLTEASMAHAHRCLNAACSQRLDAVLPPRHASASSCRSLHSRLALLLPGCRWGACMASLPSPRTSSRLF